MRTIKKGITTINVLDEPEFGCNHLYEIMYRHEPQNELTAYVAKASSTLIEFQKGSLVDHPPNGIWNEDLLEIVADRLRCHQSGPFPCTENLEAIVAIDDALQTLTRRRERIAAERVIEASVIKLAGPLMYGEAVFKSESESVAMHIDAAGHVVTNSGEKLNVAPNPVTRKPYSNPIMSGNMNESDCIKSDSNTAEKE